MLQHFADAGADLLFGGTLESEEEMCAALCQLGGAATGLPEVPSAICFIVEARHIQSKTTDARCKHYCTLASAVTTPPECCRDGRRQTT